MTLVVDTGTRWRVRSQPMVLTKTASGVWSDAWRAGDEKRQARMLEISPYPESSRLTPVTGDQKNIESSGLTGRTTKTRATKLFISHSGARHRTWVMAD